MPIVHSPATRRHLRQIGKGSCGSVWAIECHDAAYTLKREDGREGRSIVNEAKMHQRIEKSLLTVQNQFSSTYRFSHLNIPKYRDLVHANDVCWWSRIIHNSFPSGYGACNVFISERIRPFPGQVREKLIDLFCPADIRSSIEESRKEDDYLIRPYLGRRTQHSRPFTTFTLDNKPLPLNQLIDFELPVEQYARAMADALAIMHWHAHIDANNVEFVLAPPGSHAKHTDTFPSPILGDHTLWLLDFDSVRPITMDEAGVEQAAKAFFNNDPFLPRPCKKGEGEEGEYAVWKAFKERFLESSWYRWGDGDLPCVFGRRVEELGFKRAAWIRKLRGK